MATAFGVITSINYIALLSLEGSGMVGIPDFRKDCLNHCQMKNK
jgi:hypothetical protein